MSPKKRRPPEERFWEKVSKGADDECWEWQRRRDKDGYGALRVGPTFIRAHRFSYELHYGPTDLLVRHRCNNPPCVNPAHLVAGTHEDNMADRMAAGNYPPKTHCKWGHPYTKDNTSISHDGRRYCRTCRARRSREQRERRSRIRTAS